MDAVPTPVRTRTPWWLWLVAGIAGALIVGAIVLAILVRGWPAIAIARAPSAGLAIVGVGLTTADHVGDASRAAIARFAAIHADAPLAVEDALRARGFRRRGAWRLLANGGSGSWRPDQAVVRTYLLPFLTAADPSERREARAAYASGAISCTLQWLSAAQRADGTWPAAASAGAPGHVPDAMAATALATLAFLGAGYDHRMPSRFKPVVKGAIAALLAAQRPDGSWCDDPANDALVAMAAAEALAMSADPALKRPVEAAAARLDHATAGDPLPADAGTAVLRILALKSLLGAGMAIAAAQPRCAEAIRARWTSPRAVGDAWRASGAAVDDCDAAGALAAALAFTGCPTGPAARDAAATLAATRPDPAAWSPALFDFATLGIFQAGGEPWRRWNVPVRQALCDAMRLGDPALDGSWDPPSGDERDRVVTTAWRALSLEVYYRYLPVSGSTGAGP